MLLVSYVGAWDCTLQHVSEEPKTVLYVQIYKTVCSNIFSEPQSGSWLEAVSAY